jgi:hypothetical protein
VRSPGERRGRRRDHSVPHASEGKQSAGQRRSDDADVPSDWASRDKRHLSGVSTGVLICRGPGEALARRFRGTPASTAAGAASPVLLRARTCSGGAARSLRELFDQEAHRRVETQRADLIATQVIDDRLRYPDGPAAGGSRRTLRYGCRRNPARLLPFPHPPGDSSAPSWRRTRSRAHSGSTAWQPLVLRTLVGSLERGDDVLGEVAGAIGTLDEGVEVFLHHLSICAYRLSFFLQGSPGEGANETLAGVTRRQQVATLARRAVPVVSCDPSWGSADIQSMDHR